MNEGKASRSSTTRTVRAVVRRPKETIHQIEEIDVLPQHPLTLVSNPPIAPPMVEREAERVTPMGDEMVKQARELAKPFEGLPKELLEAAIFQWLEERLRAHNKVPPGNEN